MLVVKVEIWPYGDETQMREVGRCFIANVGGTIEMADYECAINFNGEKLVPRPIDAKGPVPQFNNKILGHDRRLSVWKLVVKALTLMLGSAP